MQMSPNETELQHGRLLAQTGECYRSCGGGGLDCPADLMVSNRCASFEEGATSAPNNFVRTFSELTISDFLTDPLVRAVNDADGVSPHAFKALLSDAAIRVNSEMGQ